MHPTFRNLALTAALAALTSAASAADVRLDFNALGIQAEANGAPIAVPDTDGLSFGGAFVYGQRMLANLSGFDNLDVVSGSRGGVVLNRPGGTTTNTDIIISLVQSTARTTATAPAVFFESITFNLFTKGRASPGTPNPNRLISTGANGDVSRDLTAGGLDVWSGPQTYSFDPLAQVTSLRFTAGGAAFALDDMLVTLTADPGTGGNVPEPTSYALVGLALLAAGAATRRQQRG